MGKNVRFSKFLPICEEKESCVLKTDGSYTVTESVLEEVKSGNEYVWRSVE